MSWAKLNGRRIVIQNPDENQLDLSRQIEEARELLFYASTILTPIERLAIWLSLTSSDGLSKAACARVGQGQSTLVMAKNRGLRKLRKELRRLRINSSADVVTPR